MFTGNQIREVMDILHEYKIKLYHACQFQDFVSYLKVGGIPSRQLLKDRNLTFTAFQTDSSDLQKGLFDKVFLNLQDFGNTFHAGKNAVPNPYGPILIEVSPTSSLYMSDLGVSLRSAGAQTFDRNTECISEIDDFRKIFKSIGGRHFVKFKKDLLEAFPGSKATSPEITCTFPGQLLSVDHFQRIIVDPLTFVSGKKLKHYVEIAAKKLYSNLDVYVVQRRSNRESDFQELCHGVDNGWRSLNDVIQKTDNQDLEKWAENVLAANLDYQFERFAKYLVEGTVDVIGKSFRSKLHVA